MSASLVGQALGKYKITDTLGQGGMAAVYQGFQEDVGRYVAVKVLPPHPGQSPQFVERFRLEARTIARLQHPHILPLYDYGDQDGILYLVMPFAQGGSLGERIKQGPLSLQEIEKVVTQIASALDYAHKNGVIHRDIKPDNILLSTEGDASLADFGIVRMVEGSQGLTATDGVIGTPAYMAPEQGQGLPVDGRSDIYAFGVVVYEMLTGMLPYTADTPMQIMLKHITDPLPNITEVVDGLPPGVETVMQRVLAKDADSRYQTAGEFASDFGSVVAGSAGFRTPAATSYRTVGTRQGGSTEPAPTQAQPESEVPVQTVYPAGGTRAFWLVGGVAVLALFVVVIALLVISITREPVIVVANNTEAAMPTPAPAIVDIDAATDEPVSAPTDIPTVEPTIVAVVPTATSAPTFGTLGFGFTAVSGDTVNISVQELSPVPSGEFYAAWLARSDTAEVLSLGRLSIDALGNGVLSFTDAEGRVLPAMFNQVLITRETSVTEVPQGEVAYSGSVPLELTAALQAVLVRAEQGNPDVSLLEGAVAEAEIAVRHAGLASGASSIAGRHSHAEHAVNILLGTRDDLNGDGSAQNPGQGFGVPLFLNAIDSLLTELAGVTSDWPEVQGRIETVRVCVFNASEWVDQVVDLERTILASTDFEGSASAAEESTNLIDMLLSGVDINGNNLVEPYEGECGLGQIADHMVRIGNIKIVAGALAD